ncbi:receptor-like protein EIX2 isoform X1 [Trifolium pratense]|uniref:receptor-like protein EIX2 isoform X1 n=1 Tax=Trifolium pratense TaxID=57577 RepID=UPI001E6926A6|nr:receptor-like protein EIX2 isoform X1 [Trifolium pratense]
MTNYIPKIFYALLFLLLLNSESTLQFKNVTTESAESKCREWEKQALLKFKQSIYDNFDFLSTWRDDEKDGDCCKWKGIECNNETGHVKKLDLRGDYIQYMVGVIDFTSLIALENMEYLDLSYNNFRGSQISEHIGSLTKLRYLNLSYRVVSGRIPYQIGNLLELEYLDLSENNIDGNIPCELRNLSRLQYLNLDGTSLDGKLPFLTGNLPMLQTLKLGGQFDITYDDTKWLSTLTSLTKLVLRESLPFGSSHHLLQAIRKIISNLRELRLVGFGLMDNDVSNLFHSHSNYSTFPTILDFSGNMLTSSTFQFLSNLSLNLQELYLSENNIVFSSHLYPNIPSLVILDLSYNNLTSFQFIGNFNFSSKLQELYLTNCSLTDKSFIVSSIPTSNSSSSLLILDLSSNSLRSSKVFFWIFNFTTNLQILYLSGNSLEGHILDGFGNVLKSLEYIDLSSNHLQGEIPSFFGNMCTLHTLYLSHNNFSGEISNFIQTSSWCNKHILSRLDLSYNRITGILPKTISLLSNLEYLNLDENSLEGHINESHLSNFSKLKSLDLSYNSLSLTFPSSWVPPFQLSALSLASCKLGSSFPSWIETQRSLSWFDISNAGINDYVPEWIWNNKKYLRIMNMSHNNLKGTIPNFSIKLPQNAYIILNSNQLEGPVPSFLRQAKYLDLFENKFSTLFTFLCDKSPSATPLAVLHLSNNQIKGQLPDCWKSVNNLMVLDLSNNNLRGKIPQTMGTLVKLETLVLKQNSLNGDFPSTLKNCSNLRTFNVGENLLSGHIPSWIGENMQQLIILSLSGNRFSGSIPIHLCYLQKIQILDLSRNNLSEEIPKCLRNFTALSKKTINTSETESVSTDFLPIITLYWKGVEREFQNPEWRLLSIDLSSNNLTGEIPKEIGNLIGLVSLNLSRNNLSGEIPSETGNLVSLEYLDLSRNHFSGKIPQTITQIDSLGDIDLSNNFLSGRIPFGRHLETLGSKGFEGNLNLCGEPLAKKCPEDMISVNPKQQKVHGEDDNSVFHQGFYLSLGLGYFTGFWGLMGPILIWRPWRIVYLRFLNKVIDYIYVFVAVKVARFKNWLKD